MCDGSAWRARLLHALITVSGMQMSIGVGLPLVVTLLKALPDRGGADGSMDALTGGYGVAMFVLGAVISWPQTQNSAMFSEVSLPPVHTQGAPLSDIIHRNSWSMLCKWHALIGRVNTVHPYYDG